MAQSTQDPRLAFECEQYDTFAHLQRHYVLTYFYADSTLEMVERNTGKLFLKRTHVSTSRSGFYLGATINILGRPTLITGYADAVTRQLCEEFNEKTVIILDETAFTSLGRCLSILIEECGFTVVNIQMAWVKPEAAAAYELPFAAAMQGGTRVVAAACVRRDAVAKGLAYTQRAPGTYAASSAEQATTWAALVEEAGRAPLCVLGEENSSVVVLKPALIAAGGAGSALQQLIDCGLEPTGLSQHVFSTTEANRFLSPYQGVLLDVEATASSFVGNAWVVQLVSLDDSVDVVPTVRGACGPFDPVIARKLFPKSIRARFGRDSANNCIHCCDLKGEGPIYAALFFQKPGRV